VPIILIVSWVNGIPMDLDLNLLETGSLVMTVFTTAFTLQVLKQITKKSRTH